MSKAEEIKSKIFNKGNLVRGVHIDINNPIGWTLLVQYGIQTEAATIANGLNDTAFTQRPSWLHNRGISFLRLPDDGIKAYQEGYHHGPKSENSYSINSLAFWIALVIDGNVSQLNPSFRIEDDWYFKLRQRGSMCMDNYPDPRFHNDRSVYCPSRFTHIMDWPYDKGEVRLYPKTPEAGIKSSTWVGLIVPNQSAYEVLQQATPPEFTPKDLPVINPQGLVITPQF